MDVIWPKAPSLSKARKLGILRSIRSGKTLKRLLRTYNTQPGSFGKLLTSFGLVHFRPAHQKLATVLHTADCRMLEHKRASGHQR